MAPQTPPHSRSPSLESTSTPSEFDVYSHSMTMPTASLPSGFYSMWPVAVKSRLPIMLSLRKSLSPFNLPSRPAILPKRPNSADLTGLELFAPPGGRDGSGASTPEVVEHGKPTWKYANQGLSLLESACAEAQTLGDGNKEFSRQLYIHSLTYLLRGLPNEMSNAEVASLQTALPGSLRIKAGSIEGQKDQPQRSLLHRLLATGIVQLFIFFTFLLPYIKTFLQGAYRYERNHHISERVFAASVQTADTVGKKGSGAINTILKHDNGKVVGMLASTVAWWIDGISGGIHDGVGEGMAIMGIRNLDGFSRRKNWTA
ncbi:MAG: hypothetical protein MMC33_010208 [Icmadophila ericetorum]|nr:hypothetical protein [Icmadophila ericetorum]